MRNKLNVKEEVPRPQEKKRLRQKKRKRFAMSLFIYFNPNSRLLQCQTRQQKWIEYWKT